MHRLWPFLFVGLIAWGASYRQSPVNIVGQTREDIRQLYLRNEFTRIGELAKEGNPHAQAAMGLRSQQRGRHAEAIAWYLRAAEKDNPFAIRSLALYYNNNKQHEEAARWYRRGAELGQVDHQVEYANILVEGRGVEVNHQEALAWYEKAASRNYEYAYLPLARLYAGGLGTDRNLNRALTLAERAGAAFEKMSDGRPTLVAEARALQAQIRDQLGPTQGRTGR